MSAIADSTQAIEGRYPQASREVTVGAAADRGLAKLPAQLAGDSDCLGIKRGYASGALHRRPVNASGNLQLALAVEGAQATHFFVDSGSIFQTGNADIHLRRGFGRNDVGARAAAHDPYIHRQALLQIGETGNSLDLPRELQNRVDAFFEVESRLEEHTSELQSLTNLA